MSKVDTSCSIIYSRGFSSKAPMAGVCVRAPELRCLKVKCCLTSTSSFPCDRIIQVPRISGPRSHGTKTRHQPPGVAAVDVRSLCFSPFPSMFCVMLLRGILLQYGMGRTLGMRSLFAVSVMVVFVFLTSKNLERRRAAYPARHHGRASNGVSVVPWSTILKHKKFVPCTAYCELELN